MAQANSPGGGGTQQIVIREGSSPRSNPLPFYIPFFTKRYPFRIPSIDTWYAFHIPSLELCIPLNFCKCTVFNIGIDRAKQPEGLGRDAKNTPHITLRENITPRFAPCKTDFKVKKKPLCFAV